MTEVNKELLQKKTTMHRTLQCMRAGWNRLRHLEMYKQIALGYFALVALIIIWMVSNMKNYSIVEALNMLSFILFVVFGTVALIYILGSPVLAWNIQKRLTRAGFYNSAGETPLLLWKEKDPENANCFLLFFDSVGLTYSYWIENIELLQNALNVVIGEVEWGDIQSEVILHCAPGNFKFPQKIFWDDKYLSGKDGELTLGVCATGLKHLDLNVYPHMLLAGSTGSGKSVFLRVLLLQCLHRGYRVAVADLKGGVDFMSSLWRGKVSIYDDLDMVNAALNGLVSELNARRCMLLATACPNIKQYNETHPENPYQRVVFFIDELAELLDKTGLTKEEKAKVDEIERKLVTIIRLGRAFGIHCIMATQRPDSEILRGQIRSNIDARFCSRCDSTLSILMLGDAEAATRIPKNELGLFVGADKVLFKSFILDEDTSEPSDT